MWLISIVNKKMKKFLGLLFVAFFFMAFAGEADAQRARAMGGVAMLRQLGLSQDQIKQIREMNRDVAPRREETRTRLREARQALDKAIYADVLSEADVEARLSDFNAAQAAVSAINYEVELKIRKILTPQQLQQFKELRAQFNERRERMQPRRGGRRGDPAPDDRPDEP